MKKETADIRRARAESLAAALTTVAVGDTEKMDALTIGFFDGRGYPVVSLLAISREVVRIGNEGD